MSLVSTSVHPQQLATHVSLRCGQRRRPAGCASLCSTALVPRRAAATRSCANLASHRCTDR
eukprot:17478-Amphidinium_carterae.2